MTDPLTPAEKLLAAEAEAAVARQRLSATATTLQARLDPKTLARTAIEEGSTAAQASLDTARRHPGMLAGTVAAIGLVLARRPLARLWTRATRRRQDS